ncbi:16S rRNA (cytosine(1402)-N(4))-methyltransferase RsmH [bacterium]|nr:16S rRNA (cytosine(1402)-N(4))-methyltransferase RsmH [bacterium]
MMVTHIPVLKEEILQFIRDHATIKSFCDCTLGEGGHTRFLKDELEGWTFSGFDRDSLIIESALKRIGDDVDVINDSYENVDKYPASDSGVFLLDLGISMFHYKDSKRGFTFTRPEEPLDMRYSHISGPTAADILNEYTPIQLETMLMDNADIYRPGYFIEKIMKTRKETPFSTVSDLLSLFPSHGKVRGNHPLTLFFQALRIEVNQEFNHLETFLSKMNVFPRSDALFIFISYHSGEDRRIKQSFREMRDANRLKIINKRVVKPAWEEVQKNRASRSAKLRAGIII